MESKNQPTIISPPVVQNPRSLILKISRMANTASGASPIPRNLKKEDLQNIAARRLEVSGIMTNGAATNHLIAEQNIRGNFYLDHIT